MILRLITFFLVGVNFVETFYVHHGWLGLFFSASDGVAVGLLAYLVFRRRTVTVLDWGRKPK